MKNIIASITLFAASVSVIAASPFDPKDTSLTWVNNVKISPDCIADHSPPKRTVPVSQMSNITTTVGWWTNGSGYVNVISSVWDTRHPTDDYHRKYADRLVKSCMQGVAPASSQGAFIVTFSADERTVYVNPMIGQLVWPGK